MKCKCCVEKERTISILQEQVKWFQAQSPMQLPVEALNPTHQPDIVPGMPLHLSEAEEAEFQRESVEQMLRELGMDPNVTIE